MFDRVLRFDAAILLAKIKIFQRNLNHERSHTATLEGKISKKMLHQVTEHAGHQHMIDTAKYYSYKVNATGVVTKCLSCSLEKFKQNNILKQNEDTTRNIQERECILIYHQ